MHILLTNVQLDCIGRVPVTGMQAGMNLSKPGMNLSKPGMNLSKPGKKHSNHVIICSKTCLATVLIRSILAREKLHERFSASAVFPAQNRTN